jgi:hypothetical protein
LSRKGTKSSEREALVAALVDCRETLSTGQREGHGGEVELIDEILQRLEEPGGRAGDGEAPAAALADWLATFAGPAGERREGLADIVSFLVRDLAPEDDPPSEGAAADLWQALVILVDRLYGSGVEPMGRLPFISDRLLELLGAEARGAQTRADRAGEAGRVLASLAVSGKLRDAVTNAVGFPVAPTYRAVYLYDTPRSHVHTHVDTRDYEVVFHLILDHASPGDKEGSALVVHPIGEAEPRRVRLEPGEAVALRGRGTVHSWEPMGPHEHRTLIAIGFHRADASGAVRTG